MAIALNIPTGGQGGSPPPRARVHGEQVLWLIRLRWFAVGGILLTVWACSHVWPIVDRVLPLYVVAGVLLACNGVYVLAYRRGWFASRTVAAVMVQIEIDLLVLTALLYACGGIVNPFVLFYVFHVIIATILLPRLHSIAVGATAVVFFGILALGQLGWIPWLMPLPLGQLSTGDPWRRPVYVLGQCVAFLATIGLAHYLTRTVTLQLTQKELETARQRDLLDAIIQAMAEGLLFVTKDRRVALHNPAACRWAETPDLRDGPLTLADLPAALRDPVQALLAEAGSNGPTTEPRELMFETPGADPRCIRARICPVQTADGGALGYVVVGEDLTEQKRMEQNLRARTEETALINEMLKKSRVEMAQREKMVALGQMASGIAHEIGNPLASLSSVVQYLQRKIANDDYRDRLATIAQQIDRIDRILKRMLSLARPATSEYKWSDVNAVLQNVLTLTQYDRRAKSVDMRARLSPGLPMIWANPLNLEQVFLNIVVNALDAIVAKGRPDEPAVIEVTTTLCDDEIEVRVVDTGIGMSPATCRRAFESFFTTKEIGKGTGLGLFISYNLVTEIDGTIRLDSEPGRGTTVTIQIPVRPKKHLTDAEPYHEDQNPAG